MFLKVSSNPSHSMMSEYSFPPRKSASCFLLDMSLRAHISWSLQNCCIILSLQLIKGTLPSPLISNDAFLPSWCSDGGKGKNDLEKENAEGPPRGGTAVVARIRCEGGSFWNARSYVPFSTRFAAPRNGVRLLISSLPFQELTVLIKNK